MKWQHNKSRKLNVEKCDCITCATAVCACITVGCPAAFKMMTWGCGFPAAVAKAGAGTGWHMATCWGCLRTLVKMFGLAIGWPPITGFPTALTTFAPPIMIGFWWIISGMLFSFLTCNPSKWMFKTKFQVKKRVSEHTWGVPVVTTGVGPTTILPAGKAVPVVVESKGRRTCCPLGPAWSTIGRPCAAGLEK